MIRFFLIFLLFGTPSLAQSVGECSEIASVRNLAEPWEENTATYAKGEVRVALIDTMEPAAAAVHLIVISPPRNEIGDRQCRMVSFMRSEGGGAMGFFNVDFPAHEAEYDPARGLVLSVPISIYQPETGDGEPAELTVTINQSTGDVQAEVSGS